MTPPGSLAQIPSDVQLGIVAFLDPPSIVSLSETCDTLHQICSQRVVWANAFHQMCSQNKVFVSSYPPIQEMSIAELRQHTLSPYKLLDLLYEDDSDIFTRQARKPGSVRRKIACPNDEGNMDARFYEMFLVPGGRYLVTKSGDDGFVKFRIDVWDLSLDTKGSPVLVATWACDKDGGTWVVSPSKWDDSEFLITIVMEMDTQFCILSFNPSLPGPKISPIASFGLGRILPIYQYFFNDPFLIYFTEDNDRVLTVCNFRKDLWGSYNLDVDLYSAKIMLHGDVIIICARDPANRATFYGWDISKLEPCLEYLDWMNSTELLQSATPRFVLTHEVQFYEYIPCHFFGSLGPLDQWYTSDDTSSPFACDIILSVEGEITELVFCVQFSASGTGHRIEEIVFKEPPLANPTDTTSVRSCRLSNGHLLRAIPVDDGDDIQVQISATPIGNSASESHLRRRNFAGLTEESDGHLTWDSYVFDYVSGRSCVRRSGNRTIDILEFLHPPNITKA